MSAIFPTLRGGVAALALAASQPFAALAAPPSDLIAFVSTRSGDPQIHLVSQGSEKPITQGKGVHTQPALAGDGRLAFLKSVDGIPRVFVTGALGESPRQLNGGRRMELAPSWAPDGSALAYFSADPSEAGMELHIVDFKQGSTATLRAAGSEMGPSPASWSADGSRLAFLAQDAKGARQVHVVERNGSSLVNVSGSFNARNKASAEISPDGRQVVYVADARQRRPLVLVDLATGASKELTPEPDAAFEVARWSPDGRQLAVVRSANPAEAGTRSDVFVMNPDGSGLRNLSQHPAEDFDPRWSSDGRSIVFASLRSGTSQLYRVDLFAGRTEAVSKGHGSHDMDHVVRAHSMTAHAGK